MDELKPCPFCGETESLIIDDEWTIPAFAIECCECGASTITFDTKEEAIEAWNRRACECANNAVATPGAAASGR